MSISFWMAVLFWAFLLGFLLGTFFPGPKSDKPRSVGSEINDYLDFEISDKEYKNFLSYDGTVQEKE